MEFHLICGRTSASLLITIEIFVSSDEFLHPHDVFLPKKTFCFVSQAGSQTRNFLPAKVRFFKKITYKPLCILFYYQLSGITSVEGEVTPVILSSTILKSLFAII